ncbi:hypothetical protein [uncultured Desulfuromusa sp.]|uniref:hypothetical protein n=1 Tax=uncultured Desulfuromusa sp. TaxID=219183 RepID=UPI002AA899C7|nr:hypothetical protein [uncultured Desulfuromusa sp.]
MRINPTYILDPLKLPVSKATESSANQIEKRQRVQQANDSYHKNSASSQIIDAEYVDLYNAASSTVHKQNQGFNVILDADDENQNSRVRHNDSSFDKYQMTSVDTPPPGTYLNIFA